MATATVDEAIRQTLVTGMDTLQRMQFARDLKVVIKIDGQPLEEAMGAAGGVGRAASAKMREIEQALMRRGQKRNKFGFRVRVKNAEELRGSLERLDKAIEKETVALIVLASHVGVAAMRTRNRVAKMPALGAALAVVPPRIQNGVIRGGAVDVARLNAATPMAAEERTADDDPRGERIRAMMARWAPKHPGRPYDPRPVAEGGHGDSMTTGRRKTQWKYGWWFVQEFGKNQELGGARNMNEYANPSVPNPLTGIPKGLFKLTTEGGPGANLGITPGRFIRFGIQMARQYLNAHSSDIIPRAKKAAGFK